MEDYAAPFIELIDRAPIHLTLEERDSLEFFYASVNIAEGLPADSDPRHWCLMAQDLGRVAHMLGRMPKAGEPGATPEILMWIVQQRTAQLNGYQRARLASLPGGSTLLD